MDRIDRQPRIVDQGVHDGVAAALDRQGERTLAEALAQGLQPIVQRLGAGRDLAGLDLLAHAQREGMFPVAPVQRDERGIVCGLHGFVLLL